MSRVVVPLGSVVFALIDPTPGHELAFNDWYERDHYYTVGTAAPGVFSAGRFVATRQLRAARDPNHSGIAGDPARGAHLALYFVLPGHDDARVAFATDQVRVAADEDRMFHEREHLHTWSYRPAFVWHGDADGVPVALALDHRYPAISVALVDLTEAADAVDPQVALAEAVAAAAPTGIAQILGLEPAYEIMPSSWIGEFDSARRRALVFFHDDGPLVGWGAASAVLDNLSTGGMVTVAWASAFHPAVFGTDIHADEI